MADELDQTEGDRITGADLVDGVLVLKRYDGTKLEFEVPVPGFTLNEDGRQDVDFTGTPLSVASSVLTTRTQLTPGDLPEDAPSWLTKAFGNLRLAAGLYFVMFSAEWDVTNQDGYRWMGLQVDASGSVPISTTPVPAETLVDGEPTRFTTVVPALDNESFFSAFVSQNAGVNVDLLSASVSIWKVL